MNYRIRVKQDGVPAKILDVSFSQLCEYLPPRHRNEEQRAAEIAFWKGESSLVGPRGSVKLVKEIA